MAWTESDIPDLAGRVAVVTGANGGLGLATALALAGKGAKVIMAARNQDKAARARQEILAAHPGASAEVVPLDLGSLASVERAAQQVMTDHRAVDILVNNAGLMALPESTTDDGFETQLGVNHFGHWALTAHLLPALLLADAARVVTVTSGARFVGRRIDPDNPNMRGKYDPWLMYAVTKLANFQFALGLQQQFEAAGVKAGSLAAHPGLTRSDLQVHSHAAGGAGIQGPFWEWLARTTGMSTIVGARPQLRAATDPAAKGGQFYGPRFVVRGPAVRLPVLRRNLDRDIRRLWDLSERETGIPIDVGALT